MASDYRIFTRQQVRQVDRIAIDEYRIPGIVLMENAARGLAQIALDMLGKSRRVLIICGGGNNGGDGFAAARHMHNAGADVGIAHTKPFDGYQGDAATNLAICRRMGLRLIDASADAPGVLDNDADTNLIIDGLLGTGLSRDVRGAAAEVIEWINRQTTPVLAIDIPSGLDCDTGRPLGAAVRATRTATFVGYKAGMMSPDARKYTGRIQVVDIGAPRELAMKLGAPLTGK